METTHPPVHESLVDPEDAPPPSSLMNGIIDPVEGEAIQPSAPLSAEPEVPHRYSLEPGGREEALIAKLRAVALELETTRADKTMFEAQYNSLLGKLTTMRNTLGDKLKQDAVRLQSSSLVALTGLWRTRFSRLTGCSTCAPPSVARVLTRTN